MSLYSYSSRSTRYYRDQRAVHLHMWMKALHYLSLCHFLNNFRHRRICIVLLCYCCLLQRTTAEVQESAADMVSSRHQLQQREVSFDYGADNQNQHPSTTLPPYRSHSFTNNSLLFYLFFALFTLSPSPSRSTFFVVLAHSLPLPPLSIDMTISLSLSLFIASFLSFYLSLPLSLSFIAPSLSLSLSLANSRPSLCLSYHRLCLSHRLSFWCADDLTSTRGQRPQCCADGPTDLLPRSCDDLGGCNVNVAATSRTRRATCCWERRGRKSWSNRWGSRTNGSADIALFRDKERCQCFGQPILDPDGVRSTV